MFYRGMAMREMPCCRQHLCCFCLSEFVRSKLTKQLGGEADAAGGSPSLEEVVPPCGPVLQGMDRPEAREPGPRRRGGVGWGESSPSF